MQFKKSQLDMYNVTCPADKTYQFLFCPKSLYQLTVLLLGVLLASHQRVTHDKIKT